MKPKLVEIYPAIMYLHLRLQVRKIWYAKTRQQHQECWDKAIADTIAMYPQLQDQLDWSYDASEFVHD